MTAPISDIQVGWKVFDRDGDELGEIEEIGERYVLVRKGLFFPSDVYVPIDRIERVDTDGGHAHVGVSRADIDGMGWDQVPTGSTAADDGSTTASGSERTTDPDSFSVPVREEQLRAGKTTEQAGEVRVSRGVVEEERELDVPVTRERVDVRRVQVDRASTGDEAAISDGETIRVPVTAETVQVTNEPRVVEEIEITKRPETVTERISDTVRREEVQVDASGDALSGAAAAMTDTGDVLRDDTGGVRATPLDDEDERGR